MDSEYSGTSPQISHQQIQQQQQTQETLPPTFWSFPKLPPELRLKIYNLSLPTSRLVPLHYLSPTSTQNPHIGCSSPAPIPSLLHLNRESRDLAKTHSSLSFSPYSGSPKIFFSPEKDVLYFKGGEGAGMDFVTTSGVLSREEMGKVVWLAVGMECFAHGREVLLWEFWEVVVRKYRGLKGVWIVEKGREGEVVREVEEILRVGDGRDVGSGLDEMSSTDLTAGPNNFVAGRETLEMAIQRVVSDLEAQTGWKAPMWKVVGDEQENHRLPDVERKIWTKQMAKEELLTKKMREMFGDERVPASRVGALG